ncbi:MAG TPA: MFS transporter, partial [Pseudomonas sp.]|nr:MFS transporter [Pseudomonas sp.]
MPTVIYVFSLCTFTFGLSEFVVAGLVSAMAEDLGTSTTAVGSAIAAYALGAAIGAPLLTALLLNWRDRTSLSLTLAVLAVGSLAFAWAEQLWTVNLVRFVIGLAHGVFMAIAADVAVKLVDAPRAGRALSLVWLGLTLA